MINYQTITSTVDYNSPSDTFAAGPSCGNCGRSCNCSGANVTSGTFTFAPGNIVVASNVEPVRAAPTNRAERRAEAARDRDKRRRDRQRRNRRKR